MTKLSIPRKRKMVRIELHR